MYHCRLSLGMSLEKAKGKYNILYSTLYKQKFLDS